MTLQQSKFSSELYNTIQDLKYNQSGLATEVANTLGIPLYDIEVVDDFKGSLTFWPWQNF